jgi:hypothetical protein
MDRFVIHRLIQRYQRLLEFETDEARRRTIRELLANEEAKLAERPGCRENWCCGGCRSPIEWRRTDVRSVGLRSPHSHAVSDQHPVKRVIVVDNADNGRILTAEVMEHAKRDPDRKGHLLGMAERWLRFATRADQIQSLKAGGQAAPARREVAKSATINSQPDISRGG